MQDRFLTEAKRLYGVLDKQLAQNEYVAGANFTIADMAIFPWVKCVNDGYKLGEHFEAFENVKRWYDKVMDRPGVQRGLRATPFPSS